MTESKKPFSIPPEASTVVDPSAAGVASDPTVHDEMAATLKMAPVVPRGRIPERATEPANRSVNSLPWIGGTSSAGSAPAGALQPEDETGQRTAPRIGEYALVARFPAGAAADVFLGYKTSNFGVLRRAVVKCTDRFRYDYESARQKLLDEARAIALLEHPNIVTILDLGEDEDGTYLALEYVAGTDLRRILIALNERNARMPLEHAAFVVLEVLRGLEHVHTARRGDGTLLNIVHRDVSPSNVLISEDGGVKLTDFGAVHMDGRLQDSTAPGTIKGKVRYLAPEYITTQTCTAAVDIYGTGILLFEMLTGTPCFLAKDETTTMFKIVSEGLPLADLERAGIPKPLAEVVERATLRNPDLRYPSALHMIDAIERWLEQSGRFTSATRFGRYLKAQRLLG